jgi:hypothetical protein
MNRATTLFGLFAVFAVLLSAFPTNSAQKVNHDVQNSADAEKLLREAEEISDIRSSGTPSFRLAALVQTPGEKGGAIEGTYTLLWKSPTLWRDEIKFPDYSQVRVARLDRLFISRNPPNASMDVFRLLRLLEFPPFLSSSEPAKEKKLQEKIKDGQRERVIEVTRAGRSWEKIYLDGAAPIPLMIEFKGAQYGSRYPYKDFDVKYGFEDYVEFHGHQVPRMVSQRVWDVLKYKIQVQELADATLDESDFDPPSDAKWIRWCPHPTPPKPKLLPRIIPNSAFPPQFRTGGPPSDVVIYGIIGTDGQWHNLAPVKSEGKVVDSFWIHELLRESFSPALCGEVPVESEALMEFKFP